MVSPIPKSSVGLILMDVSFFAFAALRLLMTCDPSLRGAQGRSNLHPGWLGDCFGKDRLAMTKVSSLKEERLGAVDILRKT